jgi:hypothetical protein
MAENFNKGVLNELKQANLRLARIEQQGVEDDTLKQIVANSLPEVLNDRRIEKQDKKYTEAKKMDQTDDEVRALRKEMSVSQDKLLSAFEKNAIKTSSEETSVSPDQIAGSEKNANIKPPESPPPSSDPDSGAGKESIKDRARALGAAIGNSDTFKFLKTTLGKLGGFLGGLVKGVAKTGGSIFSALFKAAGLGLLIAFLNSDMFKNFFSEENIKRFQTAIADMMDYFKNLFDTVFTEENKAKLKEKFDGVVESFKNIFNAFFDEEGNFNLFGGLKQIAIELGIIKGAVDKDAEEVKGILAIIKDNPITSFLVALGGTWLAVKAAFVGLGAGASKLLEKMGMKTPKVGPPGTASPPAAQTPTRKFTVKDGKFFDKSGTKLLSGSALTTAQETYKMDQSKLGKGGNPNTAAFKAAGRFVKPVLTLLKRVPILGNVLGAATLYNILGDPNLSTIQKTEGIAGVLGGLAGSTLGAIGGAILGGMIPLPGTTFLGGLTGGALGYFFGEEIALATAQFLTGQSISAFDGIKGFFGGGNKDSQRQRLIGQSSRGRGRTPQMTDTEKAAALNAQFAAMSPEQRNLAMAGGGANGGGAITIVNSVNKGGDTTTNMTSMSESLVNASMMGVPDFEGTP